MGICVDTFAREGAGEATYPRGLVLVKAHGEEVQGPFEPDEAKPAVVIGERAGQPVAFLAEMQTPGEWQPEERVGMVGPMFNGRFIWTGDSRFGGAPVKLMDRWETPAQYASYD